MRPLWMEFPSDKATFSNDEAFMVGNSLLQVKHASVYLPGGQSWYDLRTGIIYKGGTAHKLEVSEETIPAFQRAGTIIPRKDRYRRSSTQMANDPYTLIVAICGIELNLREVFGRLEANKNSALQQVEFWDGVERERSLSEGETELKKEAKDSFKKWVLMEETHWRQLSRELWLKKGDRNTGFFHRMANAHRRNNSLDRIKINGVWMTEDQEGLHLNRLNSHEADVLEMPFTEEEIYAALMDMNGDKALGLDGFIVAFWQSSWEPVKEEIMDLFREFYDQCSFAKSLNSTFLVLIPKKGGAEDLVAVDEVDLVVHLNCQISVMINGMPAGFFSNSKGLRQGDPLSLYLFVLGMEVLSNLIRRAVDGGFLSGCRIRGRGEEEMIVSHLLFADDTIIFCEARKEQLSALSWILAWFEAASGLRINLDKSIIIPVGEVEDIEEMAVELGCKVGLLPTVYLGLPLGAHHKAVFMWDGVEERMRKRLAQWERQYISKGGRITLIKSTMASLPIYNMSLFRMPKSVANRLEKLQRDFLWGGGSLERKVHLIKWEVVCTQKEKGGLGIRKIDPLNKALLGKWQWRFAVEKDNLWKLVIGVKYGQEEFGWRTKEARDTYGVGVLKEILKEVKCFLSWQSTGMQRSMRCGTQAWVKEGLQDNFRGGRCALGRGGHGKYGVKVAYNVLAVINACAFPAKCVWVDKVPTKAAFFAWEAAWGKILTLDRLQKRVVRALWEIVFAFVGVQWVFPDPDEGFSKESCTELLFGIAVIALNGSHAAEGELYIDDGKSFEFKQGAYIHRHFVFSDGKLTSSSLVPNAGRTLFSSACVIERIIVLGHSSGPKNALIEPSNRKAEIELGPLWLRRGKSAPVLTIRRPNVPVADDWTIKIL
ncbi:putative glucan 1,3-alpha-glucosidase [Vitis vinifera]|uniref:Putative glucan 1,3-alpha-glucosidase n=1 Tax=Vitis vinifera TaxID=29760 RepID=A0A438GV52_VITVI|nr:putative glucan 1,3-alpha-glucosidase [Vitis vinifera]